MISALHQYMYIYIRCIYICVSMRAGMGTTISMPIHLVQYLRRPNYASTSANLYLYRGICMYACMYACMHARMSLSIYIYICMYVCVRVTMHAVHVY